MNAIGWLWLLLALAAAAAIWGIGIERFLFVIRRESIKALPKGSAPIKVLHIGDIHLAPWQKRKAKFVHSLGALDIDLVVNTGDNLGHKNAIGPALTSLAPLLEKPGVFVNGSNDYYAPRFKSPIAYLFKPSTPHHETALQTETMTSTFESLSWKNLNNRNAVLEVAGSKISFIGVDDAHDDLDDLDALNSDSTADLVIGVTHAPYRRVIEAMAEERADIIFAGHTHGGQVRFPFIGSLTTNCDLPNKFSKGMSAWAFDRRVCC